MSSLTRSYKTTIISPNKSNNTFFRGNVSENGLWPIGSIIEDCYRVVDVRGGKGITGMGVVYILDNGEQLLAAKTFQQQFATNLGLIERFMREARTWILTGLHPHIVYAHGIDIIEATPYLFMEYIEADDASRLTLSDHIKNGPLAVIEAIRYAIQFCEGMEHATTAVPGLVHRDLKPDNLFISRDHTLKISDFGLVRCHIAEELELPDTGLDMTEDSLTQVGSVFGTPAYMAPEQFISSGDVTIAADIYAFGCCFYEAFSGQLPFPVQGKTPMERFLALKLHHSYMDPIPLRNQVKDCPDELHALITRCLEKEPCDRWNSYAEIRERLMWVFEHVSGKRYTPISVRDLTAQEVAQQMAALQLLDGYQSAVRHHNLRENYDTIPYAFHLALSSFFHCECNVSEERRQLEKAARVRAPKQGYEVVRRLADLFINEQRFDAAEQILDAFLNEEPDGLDQILEPYVRVRILQDRFDEAASILDRLPSSLRTGILRSELLHISKQTELLERQLRELEEAILGSIQSKLNSLSPDDRPGWAQVDDWRILQNILAVLRPDWNTCALDMPNHAVFPDLTGCPDFGSDMAWLSHVLGELAILDRLPSDERKLYAECARQIGHPLRLKEHLERDEFWFWLCDSETHS